MSATLRVDEADAMWFAPISEKSESVDAWLEEMGWEVNVKDLRSDGEEE